MYGARQRGASRPRRDDEGVLKHAFVELPPENHLPLALREDAGVDPGVLAWLLGSFPVEPHPSRLSTLTSDELREFRDSLRERFKRIAVP